MDTTMETDGARSSLDRLHFLESVVENANDAILMTEGTPIEEPGPRIVYVNETFTSLTGYTLEDVTRRRELEERLAHKALHDELTGLPNKTLFIDRLGHALARKERASGKVAVLFMDLDNFKYVNDSLGHEAGDALLVGVAERIEGCLRPGDTAARLGGDEFVVLLEDARANAETLRELKLLGVRIAIDDFGTGYSSLAYLKRFPVDFLKIDRSFVDGLGEDSDDEGIVSSVVNLARTLNLQAVAEGVETEKQRSRLRSMKCELAQGFYFSEPSTAEAASALLEGRAR